MRDINSALSLYALWVLTTVSLQEKHGLLIQQNTVKKPDDDAAVTGRQKQELLNQLDLAKQLNVTGKQRTSRMKTEDKTQWVKSEHKPKGVNTV